MSKKHTPTFTSYISGIPCGVLVTECTHHKPWRGDPHECPSDLDYSGYTEFDYILLDSKGYIAGNWLVSKITDEDTERFLKEYEDY